MLNSESREFVAGPLHIRVEYRRTADDEGTSVKVFGMIAGMLRQVLRFDCFVSDPHYHYDPDGKDEIHHMEYEGIENPCEWTLHRLERDLPEMIRRAGFGPLSKQLDQEQVNRHLLAIQETMAVPACD